MPTNFSEEGAASALYTVSTEELYKSPPNTVEKLGLVKNGALKDMIFFGAYTVFVKICLRQAIVSLRV
jgi:hypothetical protein